MNTLNKPEDQPQLKQYTGPLEHNPVGCVQSLIVACRASSQCRRDFQQTIKDGDTRQTALGTEHPYFRVFLCIENTSSDHRQHAKEQ